MKLNITAKVDLGGRLDKLTTDASRRAVMEAAGLALVNLTKRAFEESSLRPAPWPARKSGGSHALLKLSGTLQRSIAITNVTARSVTVSSDRIYAAIHQFGGTIRPKTPGGRLAFKVPGGMAFAKQVTIPARPFFPLTAGGLTTKARDYLAAAVTIKLKSLAAQV